MNASPNVPGKDFYISIEVVPPAGPDAGPLLQSLAALAGLPVDAFSVATNPVAKPRMSAMALCALIQQRTGRTAILHCTTRDHNRLSLQSLLWGARALGIDTILAAASRPQRKTPVRLISTTRRQSSADIMASTPSRRIPALFTRTSSFLNSDRVFFIAFSHSFSLETSRFTNKAFPPSR